MAAPRNYTLKRLCFGVIFLIFSLNIILPAFGNPYEVVTLTSRGDVNYHRYIDYNNYFYNFFISNADNKLYYTYSIYGHIWSAPVKVEDSANDAGLYNVNAFNDGNKIYVYYLYGNKGVVKNGTLNNGAITWGTEHQVCAPCHAAAAGQGKGISEFAVTQNYIYISTLINGNFGAGSLYYAQLSIAPRGYANFTYLTRIKMGTPTQCGDMVYPLMTNVPFKTDAVMVIGESVAMCLHTNFDYFIWNNTAQVSTGTVGLIKSDTYGNTMMNSLTNNGVNEVYFTYTFERHGYSPLKFTYFDSSLTWSAPVTISSINAQYGRLTYSNNLTAIFSNSTLQKLYKLSMYNNGSHIWTSPETVYDNLGFAGIYLSIPIIGNSDRTSTYFIASSYTPPPITEDISIMGNVTVPPPLGGKLCGDVGETNNTEAKLSKLTSIMCIGNFNTGAIINRTGYTIHNYTNQFMSAWITLSIYTGDNAAVISNEHPLKIIWQKTYEVRNNTNNLQVNYYPNLFIPDHTLVAIAISSTEDLSFNSTSNTNTQFTVNQYAPTSVSFLQSTDNRVGIYAYWNRVNVSFAGDNTFTVQTTEFISIPQNFQNFWISVGFPPNVGGIIMLIAGVIMLSIIVIVKGIDEPEKVIALLGVAAVLCASAANLIPVEYGIGVMVFVAGFFAVKIYSRIAGGSEA